MLNFESSVFMQKGTACVPEWTWNCDCLLSSIVFFFCSSNQPFGYSCISYGSNASAAATSSSSLNTISQSTLSAIREPPWALVRLCLAWLLNEDSYVKNLFSKFLSLFVAEIRCKVPRSFLKSSKFHCFYSSRILKVFMIFSTALPGVYG